MRLDVVILAAGKGTRMNSNLPKVMHKVAGKPMIEHVVDCASSLGTEHIHLVVGHGAEAIKQLRHWVTAMRADKGSSKR